MHHVVLGILFVALTVLAPLRTAQAQQKSEYGPSRPLAGGLPAEAPPTLPNPGGVTRGRSGIDWVTIPGGTFMMGCSSGDDDCANDEKPAHRVTLSAFALMPTEVTQGMFREVMGGNPSKFGRCGADCPVESAPWSDADAFCRKVGGRLPTEAEWEYAARAGSTTRFPCGNDEACFARMAWYEANSGGTTHAVRGKEANRFGLYDMLGNVYEMLADWHGDSYYGGSPAQNPPGPASGSYHVIRGGSFSREARFARSSYRCGPSIGAENLGFRCARNL